MPINHNAIDQTTWFQVWIDWLIIQYQLNQADKEDIQQLIHHIFQQLEQGNSVYFIEHDMQQKIQVLQSACQSQTELLAGIALDSENTQFIHQILQKPSTPFVFDGEALSLYRYWSWEMQIAWQLLRLSQNHQSYQYDNAQLSSILSQLSQKFDLDDRQYQALKSAIEQQFSIITGGPGTGKTFTLSQIIAVLLKLHHAPQPLRIAMTAPTGKASQRMQEALQKAISNLPDNLQHTQLQQLQPVTLHRLLGMGMQQKARYHQKNPLPYDVVVVDEASMLDLNLARLLLNALDRHARLILLGDSHQLASVDVGSVLADIQQIPILSNNLQCLTKSRRFTEKSAIGRIAQFMMNNCFNTVAFDYQQLPTFQALFSQAVSLNNPVDYQQNSPAPTNIDILLQDLSAKIQYIEKKSEDFAYYYDFKNYLDKYMIYQSLTIGYQDYKYAIQQAKPYLNGIMQQWQNQDANAVQLVEQLCIIFDSYRILTATQQGDFGVIQLNQYLENILQNRPHSTPSKAQMMDWYLGKAVMMTYNDYSLGLSNGDIGLCLSQDQGQYGVYFPSLKRWFLSSRLPQDIQPAFAMTIHKSQGSEFNHTAVILHDTAERLLTQELIYTGITRAKKQLSLWCSEQSLLQSLSKKTKRYSQIVEKIQKLNTK